MTDAERIPHWVDLAWKFRGHARRAETSERREHWRGYVRFCIREARAARNRLAAKGYQAVKEPLNITAKQELTQ